MVVLAYIEEEQKKQIAQNVIEIDKQIYLQLETCDAIDKKIESSDKNKSGDKDNSDDSNRSLSG